MTTPTVPTTPMRRRGARIAAVAVTVLLAASCSSDADPADYFAAFDESQIELEATVDALFESPVALEVGAFADDDLPAQLDAEQDALVRRFMTEFWTGALDAMTVHRDQLAGVDVPNSIRSDHDAYIDAVEAMLDQRDAYLADIAADSGAELLASFWDGSPEIDAVTATCRVLVDEAAAEGITIASPICAD